jgi:16S rRNA (cytidine1402-2'-O)-methyltransferase
MVAKLIDQGAIVSLVSDAGTPLISDPGFKLIRYIKSLSHFVEVIPGVSAPITALTLSGLATDRFLFAGFLPKTSIKKQNIFKELSQINATLIFFETATRLAESLSCAISVLGNREGCVARELTKLYQEVKTLSLQELLDYYKTQPPKGEIVLLISGSCNSGHTEPTPYDLQKILRFFLAKGHSKKSAAELFIKEHGDRYSKNELYKVMNDL